MWRAPITEAAQWLLAHLPFYVQWYRFNMFWRYGDGLLPFLRRPHESAIGPKPKATTDAAMSALWGEPDTAGAVLDRRS
jgi:4-hydroxyacetophenone monooxygenase